MIRNLFVVTLAAVGVVSAQQVPNGLPGGNGVFVQAGSTFVALSPNLITPVRIHTVANYFSVAGATTTAQMQGTRALMQSTDPRPTFYLRGISPANGIYLVKQQQRKDHREMKMNTSGYFADGPSFKQADMRDFDLQSLGPDLISLKPRMDLAPGEYAIVSPASRGHRWIHMGFEFGVVRR